METNFTSEQIIPHRENGENGAGYDDVNVIGNYKDLMWSMVNVMVVFEISCFWDVWMVVMIEVNPGRLLPCQKLSLQT